MSTFALLFTCFTSMFAFAFLFIGWFELLVLNEAEAEDLNRELEQMRRPGLFGIIVSAIGDQWRREEFVLSLSRVSTHWRNRPSARRAIWLGLAFLILAVISGQFASFPQ